MEKIDFIIAAPLLWGAFIGFKKGLVLELATLAALALGVWGAIYFSDFTAQILSEYIEIQQEWIGLSGFLVTFVLIVFAVFALAKGINKALKIIALGTINRLFGACFGVLKYALILSFILYFFNSFNQKVEFVNPNYSDKSVLYSPIAKVRKPFNQLLEFFNTDSLEEKAQEMKKVILE